MTLVDNCNPMTWKEREMSNTDEEIKKSELIVLVEGKMFACCRNFLEFVVHWYLILHQAET